MCGKSPVNFIYPNCVCNCISVYIWVIVWIIWLPFFAESSCWLFSVHFLPDKWIRLIHWSKINPLGPIQTSNLCVQLSFSLSLQVTFVFSLVCWIPVSPVCTLRHGHHPLQPNTGESHSDIFTPTTNYYTWPYHNPDSHINCYSCPYHPTLHYVDWLYTYLPPSALWLNLWLHKTIVSVSWK